VARPRLGSEATHTGVGLTGPSGDREKEIQPETHTHRRGFPKVLGALRWSGSRFGSRSRLGSVVEARFPA
jgi:hypothetical protein